MHGNGHLDNAQRQILDSEWKSGLVRAHKYSFDGADLAVI